MVQKRQGNIDDAARINGLAETEAGNQANLAEIRNDIVSPLQNSPDRISESLTRPLIDLPRTAIVGDSLGVGLTAQLRGLGNSSAVEGAHLNSGNNSISSQIDKLDPNKFPNLIIQGGTNDLPGVRTTQDARNIAMQLKALQDRAISRGFKNVRVVTIPPHTNELGKKADMVNGYLRQMAINGEIQLFDLNRLYLNSIGGQQNLDRFLARDGIHQTPRGYTTLANTMRLAFNGIPVDINFRQSDPLFFTPNGDDDNFGAILESLERENPAGTAQEEYLKRMKPLLEKRADLQSEFGKMSVEDIRYGKFFDEYAKLQDPEQKLNAIKDETVRRLITYTNYNENADGNDYKDKWFTLDYQKVGGQEQEYGIGLGDILLDPSIKKVLVIRAGQAPVLATRTDRQGVKSGPHQGRIGFVDEAGNYVATRTGDKFKICSDSAKLDSKEDREAFLKEFEGEKNQRKEHQKIEHENTSRSFASLETSLADLDKMEKGNEQIEATARTLGIDPNLIVAIMQIESGFKSQATRREPHIVAQALNQGYGQADAEAIGHSYGYFQILGMGYKMMGFNSPQQMKEMASGDLASQLKVFARFVQSKPGMLQALRERNFQRIAYLYNGAGYKQNDYDSKLFNAYNNAVSYAARRNESVGMA